MMWDDSRALRFSKTWLGLLLMGGGCLALGAGELAAMSVIARPLLPEPIPIQQQSETAPEPARRQSAPAETTPGTATAGSFTELHEALAAARERLEELSRAAEAVAATGQLRQELAAVKEENQQLIAEIDALRSGDRELESAREAAVARVVELSTALEAAKAQAQKIDEELIAVRWQNAQLNTSLAQTRAAREEIEAKTRQTEEALSAKIEALQAAGEESAGLLARLREQLEQSEQQRTAASNAQAEAEAQLAETRASLQQAKQETTRAGERFASLQGQLGAAKEQAASTQQEHASAVQQAAALEAERDDLRTRLASANDRLEQTELTNDRLESQVAELRDAAGAATDVARQNLMAVEQRIKELNEALGAITPAAAPSASGPPPAAQPSEVAATGQTDDEAPAPPPSADASVTSASVVQDDREAATETAARKADADLEVIKAASAQRPSEEEGSAALLSGLSLEQRLHVQGLLADLNGKIDRQGLRMVVPGGVLFALNSDEVQDSAHDTLAKVAELINMYDDRQVRVIGHTDALGDSGYNRMLSERRAGLVKQFFVDNFDVQEARLSTEGVGEARPIASNATLEGRRANRRVEVLILD